MKSNLLEYIVLT